MIMKKMKEKVLLGAVLGVMLSSFQAQAYWLQTDCGWMYQCPDGNFLKNQWEWIDGNFDGYAECYYFDPNGYCSLNQWIDEFQVNESGAWTEQGVVQIKDLKESIGWIELNGTSVYINEDGKICRNQITPDNFYVNKYGWKITDSGIDPEMMKEKSKDGRCLVISKSSHFLELWDHGVKSHSFVIASAQVSGDKNVEGDLKTPEGEFYICKKVPNSAYYLALALNYPTIEDAERGLRDGLISRKQYTAIKAANENEETPNWYTALGGEIEIHGKRRSTDATRGCVEMRNEDIERLYSLVSKGDKVLILP